MSKPTTGLLQPSARVWKNWIDWAKTIGIFSIVWGHSGAGYLSPFVYAFNVPLFFFLSGYLTKKETSASVFFKKLWHNLIVPYLLLTLSMNCLYILMHRFSPESFLSIPLSLLGFHSLNQITGCSNMWFVYTLVLIKLLFFLFQRFRYGLLCIGLLSLVGAVVYNHSPFAYTAWAFTNVLLALPIFLIGYMAKQPWFAHRVQKYLNRLTALPIGFQWLGIMVLLALTNFLAQRNGVADMYLGIYGSALILFVLGAFTGISAILWISYRLDSLHYRFCHIISIGTVVILAYHLLFLMPIVIYAEPYLTNSLVEGVAKFLISSGITAFFVPIIVFVKRFLPILIGSRSKA